MPAKLTKNEDALELDLSGCRGVEFQDALEKVKMIPGRRFDGDRKLWLMPADAVTAERVLHSIQPEADAALHDWVKGARVAAAKELTTPLPDDADIDLEWSDKLRPYQRSFVDLATRVQKVLLADDMGTGKTVQMIATVENYKAQDGVEDGPKLIVCPNSVKGVWARELRQWLGDDVPHQTIDASTLPARVKQLEAVIEENGWAIINYEFMRTQKIKKKLRNGGTKTVEELKVPLLGKTQWLAVLADEVHRTKNRKASQTRGLHRIQGQLQIGASGTPLMNAPDELWAELHWLFPKEYTSYWRFYEQYVDYYEGYFGKVITGVRNPDALRFELKDRLVRRTKDEVLDLPDKVRITVPVKFDPKQKKLYQKAEKDLFLEIEQAAEEGDSSAADFLNKLAAGVSLYKLPNGAARTVRLQQILETPATLGAEDDSAKLDACQEIILDNDQEQHVVFVKFVETASVLARRLENKGLNVGVYTGKVDEHDRTKLVQQFQLGEIDVIVGTIEAMKEGLTLTAARTEHFISRSWVPAVNEQAEDRCHRIGQKSNVTIYIYEVDNTIDVEKVKPVNRLKERIVSTVVVKDDIKEEAL